MTGFVLDCSIAVSWCFEDEASQVCDALLERVRDEGALVPSVKNGKAIRKVCSQFVLLCRQLNLFSEVMVAIGGSKFKAVNNRDRNYTANKIKRRREQTETSIDRYLAALETADLQEPDIAEAKTERLLEKLAKLKQQMEQFDILTRLR